jgi:excisionase family DNA binding protein
MDQPRFFRVEAAARDLSVSTDFINKQLRLKRLDSVLIGRCRLIPAAALEAFVLAAQQAQTERA